MDEELKTESDKIPETDNNQPEENAVFSDDFIIGKNFSIDEEDSLTEADLVSQYSDEIDTPDAGNEEHKGKKTKKKGCLGALFLIVTIFVVSVSLAAVIILMCVDYLGIGNSGTYEIEITKGSSTSQIAEKLKDQGVIKSDILI